MTDRFPIQPGRIPPAPGTPPARSLGTGRPAGESFGQILNSHLHRDSLKFSRHALGRMAERGIAFSPTQMTRLENAVSLAGSKGCRNSLVLIDDAAAVVSIRNGTVITVVDNENLRNNVFTEIDSSIIA